MSMVQELVAAVIRAERQIYEQIGRLTSYKSEIDKTTERVEAALSGSRQEYNRQMLSQLSATKDQIDATLGSLQAAKVKLQRLQMI